MMSVNVSSDTDDEDKRLTVCWKARQNKTEAGPPTPQGVEWAFLH